VPYGLGGEATPRLHPHRTKRPLAHVPVTMQAPGATLGLALPCRRLDRRGADCCARITVTQRLGRQQACRRLDIDLCKSTRRDAAKDKMVGRSVPRARETYQDQGKNGKVGGGAPQKRQPAGVIRTCPGGVTDVLRQADFLVGDRVHRDGTVGKRLQRVDPGQ